MRLPNLNGLRAFEAAARLLSIKDAAGELCVTPSAVSQLIRSLESELGVDLFRRGHRRLGLTAAGQALLPAVSTGFRLVSEATRQIRRQPVSNLLTVSTTAFFAESWLAPRLADFMNANPDLDVHIATDLALANLVDGQADVAIRHGLGRYPGMQSDLLLAPAIIPVAAPSLIERQGGRPGAVADLVEWPKVQDGDRGAWALWFLKHGVESPGRVRGPSFDNAGLLKAAALAGQGVALLPAPLVAPLIAAGDLIEVGPPAVLEQVAYYLVAPTDTLDRPKVKAFRTWILARTAAGRGGDD